MINLESIPTIIAKQENYSQVQRKPSDIKYIVMHYTGNVGDTALGNCRYFSRTVTKSSAHYFVSTSSIYRSVPDLYPAYAVGLGSMKTPWIPNPPYFNKCKNSNSISIEMCGSANSNEASDQTKLTACDLARALLQKYHIPASNVIRHYDVTGKPCPKWAVDDPMKWLDIQLSVSRETMEDEMENSEKNYQVFKEFMQRYADETGKLPATWEEEVMEWARIKGLMDGKRPKSPITRGELATVLNRLGSIK